MKLEIANSEELNVWFARNSHNTLKSIKGPAPKGATYSDGVLIERPVNVGWKNTVTGETIDIQYKQIQGP